MQNLLITKDLRLDVDYMPDCDVREIYPGDNDDTIKDKQKYPFILNNAVNLDGIYYFKGNNGTDNNFVFHFQITGNGKPYVWDGATIPRLAWAIIGGKGSPEFLIASLFHDYMCEHKNVVRGNRYLSSLILQEVLIACGTPKWKANLMFFFVELFQRTQGWEKFVEKSG